MIPKRREQTPRIYGLSDGQVRESIVPLSVVDRSLGKGECKWFQTLDTRLN